MDTYQQQPQEAMMIDPREFGRLEAQVVELQRQVGRLSENMEELLALANKSRGGLWVGMSIVAAASSVVTWIAGHLQFLPK